MRKPIAAAICFACFLCLASLMPGAAQAESVQVEEGWFATISNYTGCYYYPYWDYQTNEMRTVYAYWNGFLAQPDNGFLRSTTGLLDPEYTGYDPDTRWATGVIINIHDGWVDTAVDSAKMWPCICLGDEWWYHVTFDWSTYCTASPAADLLSLQLMAGVWGANYGVAWSVTPGAGSHQGHVDMDIPLTYIGAPPFALSFSPVPEPSSCLAFICGLGGLAALARRRLKADR